MAGYSLAFFEENSVREVLLKKHKLLPSPVFDPFNISKNDLNKSNFEKLILVSTQRIV